MRRVSVVLISACILLITGAADAFEFKCFDDPADRSIGGGYPYDPEGDEVAMALVFVGFPAGGDTALVHPDFHGQFLDVFTDWVEAQTYGKLSISDDSFILLPPGAQPDGSGRIPTWEAFAARHEYASPDSLPANYPYTDELSAWWKEDTGYAGTLFAEILYKIHEAYKDLTTIDLFPDQANGKPWELHFFFMANVLEDPVQDGPYFDGQGESGIGAQDRDSGWPGSGRSPVVQQR